MKTFAPGNLLRIPDLHIRREFDAPLALVWQAFTDPKHIQQWWGPLQFTNPVCIWESRPNGKILVHMHGPKNSPFDFEMPMRGMFHEVDAPKKLLFTTSAFPDVNDIDQIETLNTIIFTELGERTRIDIHEAIQKSSDMVRDALQGMEQGWLQSFTKLDAHLKEHA